MHKVSYILILLLIVTGCMPVRAPEVSYLAVEGTREQRIETISNFIATYHKPPTLLLDAHLIEEQRGDDRLGPADYRSFTWLEVAPEDVAAWQAILTPLESIPTFAAPAQPAEWWLEEAIFATVQFYAPDTVTGRHNGWVAVDTRTGSIYIYTFTT